MVIPTNEELKEWTCESICKRELFNSSHTGESYEQILDRLKVIKSEYCKYFNAKESEGNLSHFFDEWYDIRAIRKLLDMPWYCSLNEIFKKVYSLKKEHKMMKDKLESIKEW